MAPLIILYLDIATDVVGFKNRFVSILGQFITLIHALCWVINEDV